MSTEKHINTTSHNSPRAQPTIGGGLVDSKMSSLSDYIDVPSTDLFEKTRRFNAFINDGAARGFKKYLMPVKRYEGGRAIVAADGGDKSVLMFCLTDYLDMSRRPQVQEAARVAISHYGTSVSGVPLIAGSTDIHKDLETRLARLVGAEACALFQTGQAANAATIAALCTARDFIVIDKQVHASILEGVRLSGAKWRTFRHSNPEHLELVLRSVRDRGHANGILVILTGIYGLDGDVAPLREMSFVAARYGARVFLDDAHATGVLGPTGAGTAESLNISPPDVLMGSLSKAFGSTGGWIAGSRKLIDYLRYFCGSLVFSVGLAPSSAAAAAAALDLIECDHSLALSVQNNAAFLKEGLIDLGFKNPGLSGSPIVSIRIDDEPTLREVSKELFEEGLWLEAIPFPATMRGQERIRLRARASHTRSELSEAVQIIGRVLHRHGLVRKHVSAAMTSAEIADLPHFDWHTARLRAGKDRAHDATIGDSRGRSTTW